MKYFTYHQNNSGGRFDHSKKEGIGPLVVIEAENAEEANALAEEKGIYFDGCEKGIDCVCCGDRWYSVDDSDGCYNPRIYGKSVYEATKSFYHDVVYIHYKNGTIETVELKESK